MTGVNINGVVLDTDANGKLQYGAIEVASVDSTVADANTVNGKTVAENVPVGAVFTDTDTDTVYDDTALSGRVTDLENAGEQFTEPEEVVLKKLIAFDNINPESTGLNRADKTTLPIIELCRDDDTVYERISYDAGSGKMVSTDHTGQTTFGDGSTSLSLRTLIMRPSGGANGCYYYFRSVKREITSTKSIQVDAVSGLQVVILDENDALIYHRNPSREGVKYVIEHQAVMSIFNLDLESNTRMLFADEMHGYMMDGATHASKHLTDGCKYGSGMEISGVANNSDTYSGITAGDTMDEDLFIHIGASTTHQFWYREGDNGVWKSSGLSPKLGLELANNDPAYNLNNNGSWSLTSTGSDYVIMHFVATNDVKYPIAKVVGQNLYPDRGTARDHLNSEVYQLETDGLPAPEFVFLYSMILDGHGNIETGNDGEIFVDHRSGHPISRY